MKLKHQLFCIDFDGTIAYDAYPEIGELIPGAKETMIKIKELGGKIAIWTCRTDQWAIDAVNFLNMHGIPYDKFNKPFDEHVNLYGGDNARKVFADVYIDDRAIHFGGKPVEWWDIQHMIFSYEEWNVGDTIEAMEDCWGNFKKGDRFEIEELKKDADFISFGPIGGAGYWDTQELFKKVE